MNSKSGFLLVVDDDEMNRDKLQRDSPSVNQRQLSRGVSRSHNVVRGCFQYSKVRKGVELRYLINWLTDILNISKIESKKMALCLETFDIGEVIKDVSTTVQPLAAKKSNRLVIDVRTRRR